MMIIIIGVIRETKRSALLTATGGLSLHDHSDEALSMEAAGSKKQSLVGGMTPHDQRESCLAMALGVLAHTVVADVAWYHEQRRIALAQLVGRVQRTDAEQLTRWLRLLLALAMAARAGHNEALRDVGDAAAVEGVYEAEAHKVAVDDRRVDQSLQVLEARVVEQRLGGDRARAVQQEARLARVVAVQVLVDD